jgi:PilZ domain-containing protein
LELFFLQSSCKLCSIGGSMQERRKRLRKDLMYYSQIFDLYGGDLLGYLNDLNLMGVMAIGNKALRVDTKLTLAIELPELKDVTATRITIPARVAWCEQDLSPDHYNIGFEFQDLQFAQLKIIQAIMDNYEFRREGPSYNIKPGGEVD